MRVWIVEMTPQWEASTRYSVAASPNIAADVWREHVKSLAGNHGQVEFSLDGSEGVVTLTADKNGDTVTMTGEPVDGTNDDAMSVADWHALKTLMADTIRLIAQPRDDEPTNLQTWVDNADTGGVWTISRVN